jgi:hypothetical protein
MVINNTIQRTGTFKIQLYTFIMSLFWCILAVMSDKDFWDGERMDGGTYITLGIYILIGQVIAYLASDTMRSKNYFLLAICYSLIGAIVGFFIAIILSLIVSRILQ